MAFTIKSVPQGQQTQAGQQVGGFNVKSVPQQQPADKGNKMFSKIGIGAGATAAGLGAMKLGGKLFENVGRFTYGLTLAPTQQEAAATQSYLAGTSKFKPKSSVQTALDQPLLQKGVGEGGVGTKTRLGQIGTREMVGRQSEAAANNIYTKTINPIMDQSDLQGVKISYKDLVNNAKKNIKNSNKYSASQKKTIIDNINKITKDYRGTTTLKNLDLEKQAVASKVPARMQTMAKLPNELKVAQKEVANQFRQGVHNTIKNKFGVDSAKLYTDYANLKGLSKIGPKAMTQAGRKGGAGGFLSWVGEEVATPVTTTVGKLSYKVGKAVQKPYDIIKSLSKTTLKNLKSGLKRGLSNPAALLVPDLGPMAFQKPGMSYEEAKQKSDEATKALLELPGETISFLLDKALGLDPTKTSKEYRKYIKDN